jgi:NADPH:quinone reductase-like Zn-dependent oxidoreductase
LEHNTNCSIVHAASLNYRDLIIPKGKYPFPMKDNIVPGSDGAGTVESVGKHVTRFKPGGMYRCPKKCST